MTVDTTTGKPLAIEEQTVLCEFVSLVGLSPADFDELIENGTLIPYEKDGLPYVMAESAAQYFYQVLRAVAYEVVREILTGAVAWTNEGTKRRPVDSLRLQKPANS